MACKYPQPIFQHGKILYDKNMRPKMRNCGTCLLCRNERREDFAMRLQLDYISVFNRVGSFITLTYNNENVPLLYPVGYAKAGKYFRGRNPVGTLYEPDLTGFRKRIEERIYRKYGYRPKHVLVGEYGETEFRPHYHGIMLGLPSSERKMVYDCWNKGRIDIQPVTHADIRYTLSYIDKQVFGYKSVEEAYEDYHPPFCDFSNGLGDGFYQLHKDEFDEFGRYWFSPNHCYQLNSYYKTKYGYKDLPFPYSDKIIRLAKRDHKDYDSLSYYDKRNLLDEVTEQYYNQLHEQIVHRERIKGKPVYNVEKVLGINNPNVVDVRYEIPIGTLAECALALSQ